MKRVILVLFVAFLVIGCASGPKLGKPTSDQQKWNVLPEINVDGRSLKFEFGGDTWTAKNNGEYLWAGTYTSSIGGERSAPNPDITNLTLRRTHEYSPGKGWKKIPSERPQGPIALQYNNIQGTMEWDPSRQRASPTGASANRTPQAL